MPSNQLKRIIRATDKARREFETLTVTQERVILSNYQQAQSYIETELLKRMDYPIDSFPVQRLREFDLHIQRRIEAIAPTRNNQIMYALETAPETWVR